MERLRKNEWVDLSNIFKSPQSEKGQWSTRKTQEHTPPKIFHNFFRWFCHPKLRDHIEGDLLEAYQEQVTTLGERKADVKFVTDVLLLFRPGIIKPLNERINLNNYDMIRSYFKIGWRNLLKHKAF